MIKTKKTNIYIMISHFALIIMLFTFCGSDDAVVKAIPEAKPEPEPVVEAMVAETNVVETETVVTNEPEPEPEPEVDWTIKYETELMEMKYSGFWFKQIRPPKPKRLEWINANLERLREIVNELPEAYVLVLTGHASKNKKKPTITTISDDNLGLLRAQWMAKLLKSNNFPMEKIRSESLGSTQFIEGIEPTDIKNRRVTISVQEK